GSGIGSRKRDPIGGGGFDLHLQYTAVAAALPEIERKEIVASRRRQRPVVGKDVIHAEAGEGTRIERILRDLEGGLSAIGAAGLDSAPAVAGIIGLSIN